MSDKQGNEKLSGPGAGLGATGRTADDFEPGDEPAGADYSGPGGSDAVREESVTDEEPERGNK